MDLKYQTSLFVTQNKFFHFSTVFFVTMRHKAYQADISVEYMHI